MSAKPGVDQQPVWWWILLFFIAAVLWSVDINRPVDLPSWHEFDYSCIARNFVREGSNILLPRIDWRRDGPGFAEMEFPFIPWTMSRLYLIFGVHEIIGRLLSLSFSLSSLYVFRGIARKLLSPALSLVACIFFAANHEVLLVASAIQPEALMLLFSLLAVYFYMDWLDSDSWTSYGLAALFFAGAMLVKSPAAHLALFLLLWTVWQRGWQVLRRPSSYVFALLAFTPPLIWYIYAGSLWHQFHNSLGVSNEDHWLALDLLKRPKVLANLISIDALDVFGIGGLLLAFLTLWKGGLKTRVNRLACSWALAVAIYLIVILRTSSANWAVYYHIVAIAPAVLLMAAGMSQISLMGRSAIATKRINFLRGGLATSAGYSFVLSLLICLSISILSTRETIHLPGAIQDLVAAHSSWLALIVLSSIAALVTVLCTYLVQSSHALVVASCVTYLLVSVQLNLGTWSTYVHRTAQFEAGQLFRSKLPAGLIVASGGICVDAAGHHVAGDAPNMFYWLDRKGFTTCAGHESIAELQTLHERGAHCFIVDRYSLELQPGFETELRQSFPLLADSNAALLFSLDADSPAGRSL